MKGFHFKFRARFGKRVLSAWYHYDDCKAHFDYLVLYREIPHFSLTSPHIYVDTLLNAMVCRKCFTTFSQDTATASPPHFADL